MPAQFVTPPTGPAPQTSNESNPADDFSANPGFPPQNFHSHNDAALASKAKAAEQAYTGQPNQPVEAPPQYLDYNQSEVYGAGGNQTVDEIVGPSANLKLTDEQGKDIPEIAGEEEDFDFELPSVPGNLGGSGGPGPSAPGGPTDDDDFEARLRNLRR